MPFGGETYERETDKDRLLTQFQSVKLLLIRSAARGRWMTLDEIEREIGFPQASISARIRDLRKTKFGAFDVQRRRRVEGRGTWEYLLALGNGA